MGDKHGQAADQLTIWGRLNAYNVQKVVWVAEELGLAYDRFDAGFGYDAVDRTMNPNGRVPVIRIGEFVLWESNVIVRYLCNRFSLGGLCPADLEGRAQAEKWMDWEASATFRAFRPVYNVIARGGSFFTLEQAEAAVVETAKNLEILDEQLAKTAYVFGDSFSMADVPIAILTDYMMRTGREISGLSHVKRWHAALTSRPAMRTAMAVEWAD